jgi:hypothetical protein
MSSPPPAAELGSLASLVGLWRGEGHGTWGDAVFDYVEELEFVHRGKPHLVYSQRTRASDDGRPLHAESGFWRAAGDRVELVVAQGIGIADVSVGTWEGDTLHAVSTALALTPTAKQVTAVRRSYRLRADELVCTLEMSTTGGGVLPHLQSRLARVR